jgi:hypothetical protein
MKTILFILTMLTLTGCTIGEALLGAGAAGLGGYIVGHENRAPERRYEHCHHYGHHTECW